MLSRAVEKLPIFMLFQLQIIEGKNSYYLSNKRDYACSDSLRVLEREFVSIMMWRAHAWNDNDDGAIPTRYRTSVNILVDVNAIVTSLFIYDTRCPHLTSNPIRPLRLDEFGPLTVTKCYRFTTTVFRIDCCRST